MPELTTTSRTEDKEKCDNDSILLLRQMYITWLAKMAGTLLGAFLEHPEDPKDCSMVPGAAYCSTVWVLQFMLKWIAEIGARLYKLDQ